MIRSPLRAGIALACALSLSACGGSSGNVYISGTAYGVTKTGLVLTNNGGDDLAVNTSGSFVFAKLLDTDAGYNVEVKSVPSNVEKKEDCVVSNASGKAVFSVSNVIVVCKIRSHALGGTIIGLAGAPNLVLVNGSDRKDIAPAGTATQTFAMTPVSEDTPYGISILRQPDGRTCTVENPSGTMLAADINNVVVRCTQ
jgi:hypothetical protein